MKPNHWKATAIILTVLVFGLLYSERGARAQFGSYTVDVTRVSPMSGVSVPNEHVLGFSCVSEADVHGDKDYVHTSNNTTCYVLTAHRGY
jgi:hypothetical protein